MEIGHFAVGGNSYSIPGFPGSWFRLYIGLYWWSYSLFGEVSTDHRVLKRLILACARYALATQGPVVVSVDANNWETYGGGIFDACGVDAQACLGPVSPSGLLVGSLELGIAKY